MEERGSENNIEGCPASKCVDCWNGQITTEEIKKEGIKMNKFKLENTIIAIVRTSFVDEHLTEKQEIETHISPEMELDLPENAFIEDVKQAMISKVAKTLLENHMYETKFQKDKDKIKEILELHTGIQLSWLKDEYFRHIEFIDVSYIK